MTADQKQMPEEIWAYRDENFDFRWNRTNIIESTKYIRADLATAEVQGLVEKLHYLILRSVSGCPYRDEALEALQKFRGRE